MYKALKKSEIHIVKINKMQITKCQWQGGGGDFDQLFNYNNIIFFSSFIWGKMVSCSSAKGPTSHKE